MRRTVRLTESDLARIVRRVIREQPEELKITKAVFDNYGKGQTNTKGSYVVLSDGKTYNFSDNSIGYTDQCSPGEYTGKTLPQYCSVSIKTLSLRCDSTGCKKIDVKKFK